MNPVMTIKNLRLFQHAIVIYMILQIHITHAINTDSLQDAAIAKDKQNVQKKIRK